MDRVQGRETLPEPDRMEGESENHCTRIEAECRFFTFLNSWHLGARIFLLRQSLFM
jgi:hypothetical protein